MSGDKIQPFEQADALLCGYIHFYKYQRIQPKSKQTPIGKYGRMRKRHLQEHLTFSYGILFELLTTQFLLLQTYQRFIL